MLQNDRVIIFACCLALAAGMSLFGCGDDDDSTGGGDTDTDTDSDTDTDTDADTDTDTDSDTDSDADIQDYEITVTLTVPSDFSAVPTGITPAFYESVSTDGMPAGLGESVENPTIDATTPYQLSTNARTFDKSAVLPDGTYYLSVALYVEGGGTMMPEAGIDFTGTSTTPIVLPADGPVDLGEIALQLHGEGSADAGAK